MTSDQLDEVPAERRALLASFAADSVNRPCDFPLLGHTRLSHRAGVGHTGQATIITQGDPVLIQRVRSEGGKVLINVFNTGDRLVERLVPWGLVGGPCEFEMVDGAGGGAPALKSGGVEVTVPAHGSCLLAFAIVA